jgi:hypothetical protein
MGHSPYLKQAINVREQVRWETGLEDKVVCT